MEGGVVSNERRNASSFRISNRCRIEKPIAGSQPKDKEAQDLKYFFKRYTYVFTSRGRLADLKWKTKRRIFSKITTLGDPKFRFGASKRAKILYEWITTYSVAFEILRL